MIKLSLIIVALVPQALSAVADIQLRGSIRTNTASNHTSQSPTSTCAIGNFNNWTDTTAAGEHTEKWYCSAITDVFNSELSPDGYWIVTNKDGEPFGELLSSHDKCYYGATRIESHGWKFKVGSQGGLNFTFQPIDQVSLPGQLHGKAGTTNSSAEGGHQDSALVVFEISWDPQGCSSASSRFFGSGGGGLA